MKYVYSFSVWPHETWGFKPSLFRVFEMLTGRVEMVFTHEEFERFRSELSHDGFTMREIERTPCQKPETVL
jgi:hypothetical protein